MLCLLGARQSTKNLHKIFIIELMLGLVYNNDSRRYGVDDASHLTLNCNFRVLSNIIVSKLHCRHLLPNSKFIRNRSVPFIASCMAEENFWTPTTKSREVVSAVGFGGCCCQIFIRNLVFKVDTQPSGWFRFVKVSNLSTPLVTKICFWYVVALNFLFGE